MLCTNSLILLGTDLFYGLKHLCMTSGLNFDWCMRSLPQNWLRMCLLACNWACRNQITKDFHHDKEGQGMLVFRRVVNPILHTAWLDNHALTLKSNSAKYYFHEKSRFLHTFLNFCCESRKIYVQFKNILLSVL